ncbi:MAG: hypothetical protein JST16_08870 [Bdellovibrionales bacterium]|nr:hypothetical protein [Bdellovibrionales bacterium]
MILGTRAVTQPQFIGVNVVLLRDWSTPVDLMGLGCFKAFDEALNKLRSDPDATRIGGTVETREALWTTATSAALRSLPERHRSGASYWSLAVAAESDFQRKAVWTDLPAWATIYIEDQAGNCDRLERPVTPAGEFTKLSLNASDRFLHVVLFGQSLALRLGGSATPQFRRLSQLIEESSEPARLPTLSVPIFPTDLL